MQVRDVTIQPTDWPPLQQRQRMRPGCCARQDGTPATEPRNSALPRTGAGADRDLALAIDLRNWRVSHDHLPPTSARGRQASLSRSSTEFRVRSRLPFSCFHQSDSISACCVASCAPVTSECGHQRRVDRELGSSKEGQPVSHNLQPAAVGHVKDGVQVSHEDVRRDPRASLATYPRSGGLQSGAPASENP